MLFLEMNTLRYEVLWPEGALLGERMHRAQNLGLQAAFYLVNEAALR